MTTKRTITITQEILDHSERNTSSHCMLAEAIMQQIPGMKQIAVDLQTIRWTDPVKGKRYIFLTPRIAQLALMNFDLGHRAMPFNVDLRPSQIVNARRPKPPGAPRKEREKTRLVFPGTGAVPVKMGGRTPPPDGVLSNRGNRRKFGLKTLAKVWKLAPDRQGPVLI